MSRTIRFERSRKKKNLSPDGSTKARHQEEEAGKDLQDGVLSQRRMMARRFAAPGISAVVGVTDAERGDSARMRACHFPFVHHYSFLNMCTYVPLTFFLLPWEYTLHIHT